jgi:subtilase family serine protease
MRDIFRTLRAPARFAASSLAAAACLALAPQAQAGVPYPTAKTPAAVDLGVFDAQQATLSVSVMLKLRNTDALEALAAAQQTPGNPQYRQFLTPAQFMQRFGPAADTVAAATAYFRSAGLTVSSKGSVLTVSGPARAVQAAFGVRLHQFEVAAEGKSPAYRFHAPATATAIASATVAQSVAGVFGLDNRPLFRPLSQQSPAALRGLSRAPAAGAPSTSTPDTPGHWTVTDLAQYYNVQPLYDQGVSGRGKTLAIVTLASFTPSDAFQYWASLGLSVDPGRLSVVDVDGGPGAPSDNAGSGETTLDVEQSGGLAPGAKIIVYQAPNTDQGFVDAFVQAINDNVADSFSVSWGLWEFWDTQDSVTTGGRAKTALAAYTNLFLQAAVQGQSGFASSGDSGGYEPNNPSSGTAVPGFTQTLGVDAPAAAAWITAAGGTTLPGTQVYNGPSGPFPIAIPKEQAWGYSYLTGLCAALGYDPVSCGIFPGGSGGGVSSYIKLPFYQAGLPGIRVTEADQTFTDLTVDPPQTYVTLPAGYAGRNLPDVSLNADPDTGYTILYTSDDGSQSTLTYYGGTSFVAPQLNGIAALLNERAGGRVGLWNFALYRLARMPRSYLGASAPLRDITAGDNWFYTGVKGYDAATGVGTLNVTNFVNAVVGQ